VYHQPYEVTLRAFLALEDMERIDGLVQEGREIDRAYLTNAAFAAPKNLEARNRQYAATLRRPPYAEVRGGLTDRQREVLAGIFTALGRSRVPTPES
jgi:hypothetical protein